MENNNTDYDFELELDKYQLKIGKVVWAWNHLNADTFYLFENYLGDNASSAKALWESCSTDQHQRNLLKALISFREDDEYIKSVRWLLKAIDALAQYRNAFVHVRVLPNLDSGNFSGDYFTSKRNQVDKLEIVLNQQNFVMLISDILKLSNYAQKIHWGLIHGMLAPYDTLPEKPHLEIVPAQIPE